MHPAYLSDHPFTRCHYGHMVKRHPTDEAIDAILCRVCLVRVINARREIGKPVDDLVAVLDAVKAHP